MNTLGDLVNQTTEIKNDLVACHTKLKNKLVEKGVEVLPSDKLGALIDKVSATSYKFPKWFKTSSDTWIFCDNFLPDYIAECGSATVNNAIYIIGGQNTKQNFVNTIYKFTEDGVTTLVTTIPDNLGRIKNFVCANVGDKIYMFGGFWGSANTSPDTSMSNKAFCYDTRTNTMEELPSMPEYRGGAFGTSVGNFIHIIGGKYSTSKNVSFSSASAEITNLHKQYDTLAKTYSTLKGYSNGYVVYASCVTFDTLIYCLGGKSLDDKVHPMTFCYDTVTGTWNTKTKMPYSRYRHNSVLLDNKIYVFNGLGTTSGSTTVDVTDTCVCYDIATDTWTTKKSKIRSLYSNVGGVVDGFIYSLGGNVNNSTRTRVIECYIP